MSERREGLIPLPAYEDLSDKEGYLACIYNDSGTPKATLPSDNADMPLYVIRNGNTAGELVDLEPLYSNVQIQVKAKGTGDAGALMILADTGTAADCGKIRAISGNDPWLILAVAEETFVDGQLTKVRPILTAGTIAKLVATSLFDANTILAADTDNTPAALEVAEQRLVGRVTDGNIAALTGAEVASIVGDVGKVIAHGIHPWAGGAATTDSIAVSGMLATDTVLAVLTAVAATETLVLATPGSDAIALTLGAAGTDGTTKVAYAVLRAHA